VTVATPFAPPDDSLTFTPPAIPCKVVDVTTKGVTTSATAAANRAAMNTAISELSGSGGGVIDVPRGEYAIGAITLASNIELHLQQGAVLNFSSATSDYEPPVLTRWEGLDCINWQPGVYAIGATNVAITGQGNLHGPGTSWGGGTASWKSNGSAAARAIYNAWLDGNVDALKTSGPPTLENMESLGVPTAHTNNGLRPTFVECNGCSNFMIEGVLVDGGWYWNIHPLYSTNVIIRNLTVNSNNGTSNGDGVNPDSSTNVLIDNVSFNTSDDMVAIKSGTNEPGFNIARPSHNIVAHNLEVRGGHGFSIGSELSGGVNNVYAYNDEQQTWSGIQYLFRAKTPPGRGAVSIANIWFGDVAGTGSNNDILITNDYGAATIAGSSSLGTPTFSNVNIENVRGGGTSSCTTPLASKVNSTLAGNDGC
jgi:polygalacturonase